MLNKKEVTAWVERQESAAIETAKTRLQALEEEEQERILSECGATGQIEIMQRTISKLAAENEELNRLLDCSKSIQHEKYAYGGLSSRISNISDLRSNILNRTKFDSELILKLRNEKEETIRNIHATYAAVYAELRNKKNARHCLDYLKELGFDVSELERLEHTEIAVAVDRRYLFIQRRGVQDEN